VDYFISRSDGAGSQCFGEVFKRNAEEFGCCHGRWSFVEMASIRVAAEIFMFC
jgi:hypothetical protein